MKLLKRIKKNSIYAGSYFDQSTGKSYVLYNYIDKYIIEINNNNDKSTEIKSLDEIKKINLKKRKKRKYAKL